MALGLRDPCSSLASDPPWSWEVASYLHNSVGPLPFPGEGSFSWARPCLDVLVVLLDPDCLAEEAEIQGFLQEADLAFGVRGVVHPDTVVT